jgi:hypothetical protein
MSYITRLSQAVQADANNTSVANLSAGAYFIGLPTSTLGIVGIQVSMKTDQNCTVFIQQALGTVTGVGTVTTTNPGSVGTITGVGTKFLRDFAVGDQIFIAGEATHYIATITSDTVMTATAVFTTVAGAAYTFYPWDITDIYNYYAIEPFGITVQAINSYVRIKVVNFSASTTAYFRLQTCLCPIVEAVPRSLDVNGNFKIGSITDKFNFNSYNTPQGETRSVVPIRLVGAQFDLNGNSGVVDTNFWTPVVDATAQPGTIVQANGAVTLNSGTNAAAYSKLYSVRRARYIGGHSLRFRSNIRLGDTGTADNTRRWGIAYGATMPTITDGAWFQVSGTTFSIVTMLGTTPTVVSSGSFNGNLGASFSLTTNVTIYEIYWTNAAVYFVIGGLLLHKVNALTSTWAATMSPYVYMDNVNSNTLGGSVSMIVRNAVIHRLGPETSAPRYFYQHGANTGQVLKYGPGRLHRVVVNSNTGTTITLYDATSATNTLALINPNQITTLEYNIDFYNGLYLVSVGSTIDATIVYE